MRNRERERKRENVVVLLEEEIGKKAGSIVFVDVAKQIFWFKKFIEIEVNSKSSRNYPMSQSLQPFHLRLHQDN
jgi:hypothetical protein